MTLGNVGHHISVFHIDGTDAKKVPHIVNSCLAFIHSYLSSRDKFFIRERVCNIFSLEQIKAAREILYKTLDPQNKYNYNGPRSKSASDRDRINDAYEGIYSKMMKIDADNSVPIFSVPSTELHGLMSLQEQQESTHASCDTKFKHMEERLTELAATFNNYVSIVSSGNQRPTFPARNIGKSSIPPATRNRLLSNASKRSASEVSDEETSVPEDVNSENDDAFVLPRKQYRKKARRNSNGNSSTGQNTNVRENSNKGPLYSQVAQKMTKLPATKGTVKSSSSFRAAVPDIFLFNCHVKCTTQDVEEFFNPYGINIRKVEKKSHELSARSSFKLSPETKDDYDKILCAEFLPDEICARKYIFRRGRINTDRKEQFQNNGSSLSEPKLSTVTSDLLKELNALDPNRITEVMDSTEEQGELSNTQNGSNSK